MYGVRHLGAAGWFLLSAVYQEASERLSSEAFMLLATLVRESKDGGTVLVEPRHVSPRRKLLGRADAKVLAELSQIGLLTLHEGSYLFTPALAEARLALLRDSRR